MTNTERVTGAGTVRGVVDGETAAFKGIPFGQAPTGELRFAPTVPMTPWAAVRDCTAYGPISPQNRDPLADLIAGCEWNFYHPQARQAEDCLNLNVWTPCTDPVSSASKAVLVWIHGGAFLAGSGTGLWTDGRSLAAQEDVVVVTLNYRLGALGGLALDDRATTANNFLRDQVAALRWVRDNISAFGGSPDRVTIAGESAGAMSVVALLAAPEARGLFHRAIVQSGHASMTIDPATARQVTRRFLTAAGQDAGAPSVARLRRMDLQHILRAQASVTDDLVAPFRPVIDGVFLPRPILDLVRSGEAASVPLLLGTNTDENKLFEAMGWGPGATGSSLQQRIRGLLPDDSPDTIDSVVAAYLSAAGGSADEAGSLLSTDVDWRVPVNALSAAHSRFAPTYQYEFTQTTEVLNGVLGSPHALDIPYFFGNLEQPGVDEFVGRDAGGRAGRDAVETQCRQAWGSFIRDGVPRSQALPRWPTYDADSAVMMLGSAPSVSRAPHSERLDLWAHARPMTPMSF